MNKKVNSVQEGRIKDHVLISLAAACLTTLAVGTLAYFIAGGLRTITSIHTPIESEYAHIYIVVSSLLAGFLTLSILFLFNSRLRRLVQKRTQALEEEINVRTLAEEKLRLTRISVEAASDALFWMTPDARIVDVNTAACQSLGYTREELLQLRVSDVDTHYNAAIWQQHFPKLQEHGTLMFESEHRAKNGRVFPVEIVANYVQVGTEEYNCAFVRDITERKQVEKALASESSFLKTLFEYNGSGHLIVSSTRDILNVNQKFCDMFGYTKEELIGQNAVILHLNQQHYDDWAPHFLEARDGKTHLSAEYPWRRKDLSIFWCVFTGVKQLLPGGDHGVIWSVIDITERKKAEELLIKEKSRVRLLLDSVAEGIVGVDTSGHCIMANPAALRLLGISGEADLLGKNFHAEHHHSRRNGSSYPFHECLTTLAIHGESPTFCDQEVFWRADGSAFDVEYGSHPIVEEGQGIGAVIAFSDITERRKFEAELESHRENLEALVESRTAELLVARDAANAANQAKSMFLASMSHELRTPLNSIVGFSQLLMADEEVLLAEEQRSYSEKIFRSGKHLLRLINDILDLTKIESGKLEMSTEAVTLSRIIDDSLEILKPMAEQKQVCIRTNGLGKEKIFIQVDRIRCQQVIMNLVSNAIKYNSTPGEVRLSCTVEEDVVRLHVADTGPGIATEKMEFLFKPFDRLGKETSDIEGTGIGLTITKRLMEQMNGSITVASREGKGTTFSVAFPRAAYSSEVEIEEIQPTRNAKNTITGSYTFLYIEDNAVNRDLFAAICSLHKNITLLLAENGQTGIDMAIQHRPDLIFTDICLPEMDGYEILKHLRSDDATRNIPVVALSGNVMPLDIKRGQEAGFERYLSKPFSISELFQNAAEILGEGNDKE